MSEDAPRRSGIARIGLATKFLATSHLCIAVVTAAMLAITVLNLRHELYRQAAEAQETNMRVAWQVLREGGRAVRLVDGRLMAGDVALDGNTEIPDRIRALVGGTATIFLGDRRIATNVVKEDGSRAVGTTLTPGPVHDALFRDKAPYRGEADILGHAYFTAYDPILDESGKVIGALYVGTEKARFFTFLRKIVVNNLIMSLVVAALAGGFVHFVVRRMLRPLSRMQAAMLKLAEGDVSVEIAGAGRGDEIGGMARAVQVFKDNAVKMAALGREKAEQEKRAERERRAAFERLAGEFEASVKGVVEQAFGAAQAMRAMAEQLSQSGTRTAGQADSVAAAADHATSKVEAVSAAAEELTASISEIARQVAQSATVSRDATAEARAANERVGGLAAAASSIGEVVRLITEIAEQTNLLALNATIEAARAGEAGRGFAVVASEVKTLAGQTARATDDITAQIQAIQATTGDTVRAIQGIGRTVERINEAAAAISSAVEEQGAATQDISRNVADALGETARVASNISGVREAAGATTSIAAEVLAAAEGLSQRVDALRGETERFLARVRAA
jgi:methyl-accepting chemotaxis protein